MKDLTKSIKSILNFFDMFLYSFVTIVLVIKSKVIFSDLNYLNFAFNNLDLSQSSLFEDKLLSFQIDLEAIQSAILFELTSFVIYGLLLYLFYWIVNYYFYNYEEIKNNFILQTKHSFLRLYFNIVTILFSLFLYLNFESYSMVFDNSNTIPSLFLTSVLLIAVTREIVSFVLNTIDSLFSTLIKKRSIDSI